MDIRRAEEIASSADMINVTYDGKPIYIEQVNSVKDTASIHFLNRPESSEEVSLSKLVER